VEHTLQQYNRNIAKCKDVFLKKTKDYGTAWRILRPTSLTDQLFIKASRIRSIEELKEQKVADAIDAEYIGLVNYCVMALIQLELPEENGLELNPNEVEKLYDHHMNITRELMMAKNHDYGEAWRDMRISSLTDLILMKLLRIKQIEDNKGETLISEGLDANFQDIINYALFALIRLEETNALKK
jgi:hypothetical protein